MILSTMKYKEIYDNLIKDKKKVDIKKEYLLPKAIKALRKAKKYPAYVYFDYKIPATNNHYLIFFYAENIHFVEKPQIDSCCMIFHNNTRYILKWMAGAYKHTSNSDIILLRQIHVYTNHFFQRYNERFLKKDNIGSNDIICQFFARNKEFAPIEINNEINKNIEKYGEGGKYGFRIRDGFCFTKIDLQGEFDPKGNRDNDEIDAMLILYTTYMPEFQMDSTQQSAINEVHNKLFEKFTKEIQTETCKDYITLTLSK